MKTQIPIQDYAALTNTVLVAVIGGLVGWFSQDMRKRISNIERRLGAAVRGLFYVTVQDPHVPEEAKRALEEAMKETK